MRFVLISLLAFALTSSIGCSIMNSSGSISDSISSPSESISNSSDSSSGGGGDESSSPAPEPESMEETSSYREDVSQLTETYLASGGDIGAFDSALSDLAMKRGVTDWEADVDTSQAIGVGAARAGLQGADFNAFGSSLFGEDLVKLNELRKGYKQVPLAEGTDAAEKLETPSELQGEEGSNAS